MLSGMRAFAKSKWAIVLLALLAIALGVGVGISNPFAGVTGGGFVQAGNHSFGTRDANRYLNQYIRNVDQETGEVLTAQQAAAQGITNQIVGVLQQRAATLAYADRMDVKASPTAVAKIFAEAPRFRDALGMIQLGEIDNFAYNESFRDRAEFESFQRDEVTMGYLEQAALAGLSTPQILVEPLVEWVGERRQISYAVLTQSSTPEVADPTTEELQAFYDERRAGFEQPERRAVSAILYSPQDYVDTSPITDEMVASAYEARIRTYTSGELRQIFEVTSGSASNVQAVVDLVKQGVSVQEAVAQVSDVTLDERDVETGDIADPDYSSLIFGLPVGEIAGPFPIEGVSTAVVVESVSGGNVRPLEDVAEELRVELAEQDARRAFNSSSETFYDLVGAGVSLEEIAAELQLPIITLLPVDRNGASERYGAVSIFRGAPDGLAQLFNLQEGETTDVVEENDLRGVFRLDEIVEPYTPTFDDVRDELEPIYRSVKLSEQVDEMLSTVVSRVNAGEDLEVVAGEFGLRTANPEQYATRPMDPNMPNPVLAAAFGLEQGTAGIVRDQQSGPLVVVVRDIQPIDPTQRELAQSQVEALVRDSLSQDVQQAFTVAVTNAVDVRINENAVNQYLNSYLEDPQ